MTHCYLQSASSFASNERLESLFSVWNNSVPPSRTNTNWESLNAILLLKSCKTEQIDFKKIALEFCNSNQSEEDDEIPE